MSVKTLMFALAGSAALAAAAPASAMPLQPALPAAAGSVVQTVASDDTQTYRPHHRKAPRYARQVRPAPAPPVDYSYSYVAPAARSGFGGFGGFGFGYDYTPHELYYYDIQREQTPVFGH
ncbi:hypothetical protein [Labrys wisconsinensis]|uniref:Uncharacterized protein n=1 Tax=Labrys wisconsinensis TaxID=425677 RepID=A0ABU0J5A5_9HYPH|nr:hypothetical protein [Labrys wisconsinensis]MDQ0469445.1 hypothetical protein [Labrys wisconsinensis]